jgi:hypothetical protein
VTDQGQVALISTAKSQTTPVENEKEGGTINEDTMRSEMILEMYREQERGKSERETEVNGSGLKEEVVGV